MQKISAYTLETPQLEESDLENHRISIFNEIEKWLLSKKVVDTHANKGIFRSKTPGFPDGRFNQNKINGEGGELYSITLTEASNRNQNIATRLFVAEKDSKITIYIDLSIYNTETILAPVHIVPRCPKIVRNILKISKQWLLNKEPAPSGLFTTKYGCENGKNVFDEIISSTRSAPIILVSQYDDVSFWPNLAKYIAADLAGLAHVIEIDEDASESIESEVGRRHRCAGGAIRLFWPHNYRDSDKLQSEVWTSRYLDEIDQDGRGIERFRDVLREKIMGVSALTVTEPRIIQEIQNAAANEFINELRSRSTPISDTETIQIVELYAQQNETLRQELAETKTIVFQLATKQAAMQYEINKLKQAQNEKTDDNESDILNKNDPQPGDQRIVKKISSNGAIDRMVEWGGCNHSNWEPMGNAPKALKGIERLYKNAIRFEKIDKCLSCTGGGVWRITW